MWGEGGRDLEPARAISVLGFKGAAGGGTHTHIGSPPDPLLRPDPWQESVRGRRDGDGPRAGDVPVCGAPPACTHWLKNKGNDCKTGPRAGWCQNVLSSRSSKGFSTPLLVPERMGERMGLPPALHGPFWGPLGGASILVGAVGRAEPLAGPDLVPQFPQLPSRAVAVTARGPPPSFGSAVAIVNRCGFRPFSPPPQPKSK